MIRPLLVALLTVGIVVAHHPYVTAGRHNGRLATGFDIVSPLRRGLLWASLRPGYIRLVFRPCAPA